jgi:hypothetical protein
MKPAAFQATYSDFKLVKTRKVAQLIFEVPLEAVDAALAVVGGMPDPSAERWFGIAALNGRQEPQEAEKQRREWQDLPPATQAALRCQEPTFQTFLREVKKYPRATDEEGAATAVRYICNVNTRAMLSTHHDKRVMWHSLDNEYQAWKSL